MSDETMSLIEELQNPPRVEGGRLDESRTVDVMRAAASALSTTIGTASRLGGEIERLRASLENILEARDDNQPAALNMPDLEYARSIIRIIHREARAALSRS